MNSSNQIKKLALIMLATVMIQLVITIGKSEQASIENNLASDSDKNVHNMGGQLGLSNHMIHYLIKKFENNAKLRDYLHMYKKKKMDENFGDDGEDDYNYQTRFRF